jgi:hypothetical protein
VAKCLNYWLQEAIKHAWRTWDFHIKFVSKNLQEKFHLSDLDVDRRILNLILNKYDVKVWNEFKWLRTGSSGRQLWIQPRTSLLWTIHWPATWLSFSRRMQLHAISLKKELNFTWFWIATTCTPSDKIKRKNSSDCMYTNGYFCF